MSRCQSSLPPRSANGRGERHDPSFRSGGLGRVKRDTLPAIVIRANISDLAEAKRDLGEVIRGIREARGFLGAYFMAIDDSHGISIEVFETGELARSASPPEGAEAPGVTVRTILLGEVIGSA